MNRASREFLSLETLAANLVRSASGSGALIVVIAFLFTWLLLGPLSGFSSAWQSAIAVPTSAVTFLMVFVILRVQNKDTRAIHLKLNEIIVALNGANSQLIGIENRSEKAIAELCQRYEALATRLEEDVVNVEAIADSLSPKSRSRELNCKGEVS